MTGAQSILKRNYINLTFVIYCLVLNQPEISRWFPHIVDQLRKCNDVAINGVKLKFHLREF